MTGGHVRRVWCELFHRPISQRQGTPSFDLRAHEERALRFRYAPTGRARDRPEDFSRIRAPCPAQGPSRETRFRVEDFWPHSRSAVPVCTRSACSAHDIRHPTGSCSPVAPTPDSDAASGSRFPEHCTDRQKSRPSVARPMRPSPPHSAQRGSFRRGRL